jgi:hypothetical protein
VNRSEDLFVGAVSLILLPLIASRIVRGIREGRLPLYRSYLTREEDKAKFHTLLALHAASFVLLALVAADLLLGLNLKDSL